MIKDLGLKLRRLRENLGLTQKELSEAVALSTNFISNIEGNKQTPSLESLKKIAAFLKKDITYFMEKKENAFEELLARKPWSKKTRQSIVKFRDYCEDYIRLEEITKRPLETAPLYTNPSPEAMAWEERCRLGIGDEPVHNIFSLLEINGLRILRQPLPEEAEICGIFVFDESRQAAFAMINSSLTDGQQRSVAVHQYCHYLRDRSEGLIVDNLDILSDEYIALYHPRERFAQRFTRYFLIPEPRLQQIITRDIHSGSIHYEDAVYLKRYFSVDMERMLRTLAESGYLSAQKLQRFRKEDHDAYEKSLFGDRKVERKVSLRQAITSDRYKSLGVIACQDTQKK